MERKRLPLLLLQAKRDILIDIVEKNIWGTKFSEIEYKKGYPKS